MLEGDVSSDRGSFVEVDQLTEKSSGLAKAAISRLHNLSEHMVGGQIDLAVVGRSGKRATQLTMSPHNSVGSLSIERLLDRVIIQLSL